MKEEVVPKENLPYQPRRAGAAGKPNSVAALRSVSEMEVTLRMFTSQKWCLKKGDYKRTCPARGAQCSSPVRWHSRVSLVTLWEKRMWPKIAPAKSWKGEIVKAGNDL